MTSVDLNSDLGEGFGSYACGDDAAMLGLVSSANVACGFHAGDPEIMAATFRLAKQNGVAVGAHPGFPDLWGFGRRRIPFSSSEIEHLVAYQIGAAQALATQAGHRITYVKAHGALANIAAEDDEVADAVARAIRAVDPSLAMLAIALSAQTRAGERAGLRTVAEVFADRGYDERGGLIRRGQPNAMLDDPEDAARRALAMVAEGAVFAATGKPIATDIGSICIHGDSAGAVEAARLLRARLVAAGVAIKPFAP